MWVFTFLSFCMSIPFMSPWRFLCFWVPPPPPLPFFPQKPCLYLLPCYWLVSFWSHWSQPYIFTQRTNIPQHLFTKSFNLWWPPAKNCVVELWGSDKPLRGSLLEELALWAPWLYPRDVYTLIRSMTKDVFGAISGFWWLFNLGDVAHNFRMWNDGQWPYKTSDVLPSNFPF